MTQYTTVQEVRCTGPGSCETRLDPLMEALLAIEAADESVSDPDLAASLVTGHVDVQMTIEAADTPAAATKALATLRAAIHAIGDATPGWETDTATLHVTPVECDDLLPA